MLCCIGTRWQFYFHFISIVDLKFVYRGRGFLLDVTLAYYFQRGWIGKPQHHGNNFLIIQITYFNCYESILFDLFHLGFRDRSTANMELSHNALQGSTPVLRVQYPTLGKLLHLLRLHLTSAEMKTINIFFFLLQLPSKCLDKDLIIENAESCFYWKNKTGKKYWLQTCLGKKMVFWVFHML